jgi:hypothetical protein
MTHHEVLVCRREVDLTWQQPFAIYGYHDRELANAVEPPGKTFDEALSHVLYDDNGGWQIWRKLRKDGRQRRGPTR